MKRPAALVLAFLLLHGCGVPLDESARPIDRSRVPFGLLEPDAATSTTAAPSTRASAEVFLVRGDRLAAAPRETPIPVTPQALIMALLEGPTRAEAEAGLRTAITTTSGVLASGPEAGLVRIELGRSFTTSGASDQILAFAQLVYTVTSLPGASRVSFTLAGRPVDAPTGDGALTGGPLGRDRFSAVAP